MRFQVKFASALILLALLMMSCMSDGRRQANLRDAGRRNCSLFDVDDYSCVPESRQAKSQGSARR
jgi:hypothetical protein